MTGALSILAQARASGRLGEDEFRALAEIAPRFVDVLKDGLGVTARELMQMAKRKELTVHRIEVALR